MDSFLKLVVSVILLAVFSPLSFADEPPNPIQSSITKTLNEAFAKRSQQHFEADREYRVAVASTFRHADRVEIYLLDFGANGDYNDDEGNIGFDIPVTSRWVKILQKDTVPVRAHKQWCEAVTKAITNKENPNGGFGCYLPIHGIRIYAGETLLFETAICWKCNNYFCDYGAINAKLEVFTDGRDDLKALFNEALPVTEELKARLTPPKSKF